MNPVLLKPGGDGTTQVVVLGRAGGRGRRGGLPRSASRACLAGRAGLPGGPGWPVRRGRLRGRGQPGGDQPRAAATSPTWAWPGPPACRSWWSPTSTGAGCSPRCTARSPCCDPRDQALVAGFVINKFRGDRRLLEPGLDMLRPAHRPAGPGRAALGRWPLARRGGLPRPRRRACRARRCRPRGGDRAAGRGGPAAADQQLHRRGRPGRRAGRGGAVRRRARRARRRGPGGAARQPGHRRRPGVAARAGLADAVAARAARGRPVLGICGGYQMLARQIHDDVESGAGLVPGLGLLPAVTGSAPARSCAGARTPSPACR